MTRLPHPACVWVANLLVPGAGLVWVLPVWFGVVVALVWAAGAATWVLSLIWSGAAGHGATWILAASAVVVYVMAQVVLFSRLRRISRLQAAQDRDDRFKSALAAYLQERYDEAEKICRTLLCEDPEDVEATLQLAAVARARGDTQAARRYLVRARYLDDQGRWNFRIGRELADLAPPAGEPA